jgi:hypothetical protein
MIKAANNLVKLSNRLAAKDLVDMDSTGGLLVDILGPGGWNLAGESRPGRATAMADAIKKDPGFLVNHPRTSLALSSLAGALLGGGLGIGAGYAAGGKNNMNLGAILGSTLGSAAGLFGSNLMRRAKMKEIAKAFDEAEKRDPVDYDQHSLDLLGGTHALGRQEAIAAMREMMPPDQVGQYGDKPYLALGGNVLSTLFGLPAAGTIGTRVYDGAKATELANKMRQEKKD